MKIRPTYQVEILAEQDLIPLDPDPHPWSIRGMARPRVTTVFRHYGETVLAIEPGGEVTMIGDGVKAVDEMVRRANAYDDLVRLLHQADGQLGLAVHRGEGERERWKQEASALITRIRKTLADD